mmetsp:Transcript_23542/g.65501  ORF Transcript_23542/g.65501 Transcript_23542/m.65501 type:complete len:648 (+) Transcript_23542:99-2042(+)
MNNAHDDSILVEKISALCLSSTKGFNNELYHQESLVCALLLLSRVRNGQIFLTACHETSLSTTPILFDFSLQIVRQLVATYERTVNSVHKESHASVKQQVLEKLCRLVSYLLARILDEQTKEKRTQWSEIPLELLRVLQYRRQLGLAIGVLDLEILNVIRISNECSLDDEKLFVMWQIYETSFAPKLVKQNGSDSSDSFQEEVTSPEDQLMIDTLVALLDQNSSWPSSPSDAANVWHETMFLLFQQNVATSKKLPKFWKFALEWWLELKKPTEPNSRTQARRVKWAWLLVFILDTCKDAASVLGENQWRQVMQLLLACAVSTSEEIASLRPLTWMVVCRFWPELLDQSGLDKQVCSLLRLAVGEWNIQLEKTLQQGEKVVLLTDDYDDSSRETTLSTVRACGQIVGRTVEWIATLEQRLAETSAANQPKRITQSSIKSVTQSLEHALDICVQFFQQNEPTSTEEATEVVVGVLGALLTEFDCFSGAQNKGDNEERTKSLIMSLLRAVMICQDRTQLSFLLFPAMTTVLASAQGDAARVAYLTTLVEPTKQLVDSYWSSPSNNTKDEASVVWICQVMELVFEMFHSQVVSSSNSWKTVLIQFLKESGGTSKGTMDALVGCYVTLQGSNPPPDHDAHIIEEALTQLNSS